MTLHQDVLRFWITEIGEEGWYTGSAEIDRACTEKFGDAVAKARAGAFREWLTRPESALAYLILTDQLPRNIHRGTANAFATDHLAHSAASLAVSHGFDRRITGPQRQFFYLPYEHAENRQAQAAAVCLFLTRMPEDKGGNLLHARVHREMIHRYGRFPLRNAALGRTSSPAEQQFLDVGGYGAIMEELKG